MASASPHARQLLSKTEAACASPRMAASIYFLDGAEINVPGAAMSIKTLLIAILTLLSFSVSAAVAQTMPFRAASVELAIPISSGCGIGVHRGPFGECSVVIYGGYYRAHQHAYYRGYFDGYRHGYYDGSRGARIVNQGACSGHRMYRVCDAYGRCWATCSQW